MINPHAHAIQAAAVAVEAAAVVMAFAPTFEAGHDAFLRRLDVLVALALANGPSGAPAAPAAPPPPPARPRRVRKGRVGHPKPNDGRVTWTRRGTIGY